MKILVKVKKYNKPELETVTSMPFSKDGLKTEIKSTDKSSFSGTTTLFTDVLKELL
jgi:hypothetical protein